MAYYHLFRIGNEESPSFVDAGWSVMKIDEFTPAELERYGIYSGNFIHHLFIPEAEAADIQFRRGNDHTDWKNSSANPFEKLSDIKDGQYANAWEIKFGENVNPDDYYLRQKYPKELDYIGTELGEEIVIPEPEILKMGRRVEELMRPPSPDVSRL